MVREIIEKEVSAAKHALDAMVEWLHPTRIMKRHAFDRPLDDLGRTIDEPERPEGADGGREPKSHGR